MAFFGHSRGESMPMRVVSEVLKVSPDQIRRWAKTGYLPYQRCGNRYFFNVGMVEDIRDYIEGEWLDEDTRIGGLDGDLYIHPVFDPLREDRKAQKLAEGHWRLWDLE